MRRLTICAGVFVALLTTVLFSASNARTAKSSAAPSSSRSFDFTYLVHVPSISAGEGTLRVWIPLPQTGPHQKISGLRISAPLPYRMGGDTRFGNRFAVMEVRAARGHAPFDIRITFHAHRMQYKTPLPEGDPPSPVSFPPKIARYLLPDRLIPIDGMIGDLSREQTAGITDPLAKARKIYEYVIAHMHYDHNGTGWGHGDAIFACTAHHGNCTDFHSLFIGMTRAAGIPARFDIGFAIPPAQHAGKIAGYHCWAEFYIQGEGWIPVDAAEAWQNPARHNYYFGALDADRVRFTRGRDLILQPAQSAGPVNYIVYPYAERNGKPFSGVTEDFSFRDSRN